MAFKVVQSGETRVNTTTENSQANPSLTTLKDGGWIVTWSDSAKDGSGRGIYQQRYAADGTAVGGENQVNTTITGHQEAAHVTALSDGGWIVTWMSDTNLDDEISYEAIYQQRYAANGAKVGDEILVSGTLTESQGYPCVTALGNGGWVVTWLTGDQYDGTIYQRRYDFRGNAATPEPVAIEATTTFGPHINVSTTALPNGGWIATWTSGGEMGGSIMQQCFDENGTARGEPDAVAADGAQFFQDPSVTILTDGGWVVTWSGFAGTKWSIRQQRYAADGTKMGSEITVNTSTGGHQMGAEVKALPDGGWIVSWIYSDVVIGANYDIAQQRYDAGGNKVGGETIVNATTAGRQYTPAVTVLNDGSWVIAWESQNQDGSGYGIYQQRTSGNALTTAKDKATGTADADTLYTTPDALSEGDTIDGGGGMDTLMMTRAGTLDLRQPDVFNGIEIVSGSDGADTIVANTERFESVGILTGGDGFDTLRLMEEGGIYNFSGQSLMSFERIELAAGASVISNPSHKNAVLVLHSATHDGTLTFESGAFTAAERLQLYAQGIDTIIDSEGTHTYEALAFSGGGIRNVPMTATAKPFADAVVTGTDGMTVTATITFAADHGRFLNLSAGAYNTTTGTYIIEGDAQTVQAALRALTFDPRDRMAAIGSLEVTTFSLKITDGNSETAGQATVNSEATNVAPGEPLLTQAWVEENAAAGTVVGDLLATDPNPGDGLKLTLTDNAGGRFALSGNRLVVAPGAKLDYETQTSHQVTVQVTDGGGLIFNKVFTIAIGDVAIEDVAGTKGKDRLIGGSSSDKLNGGLGKDTLTGGAGKDIFVFDTKPNTKTNLDTITDFNVKDDTIWLDNKYFKKLGKKGSEAKPAKLDKKFFTIGDKAKDANDYLIYNKKKGILSYDADGSGKGKAVEIAKLSKNLKLTAADFLVI